MVLNLAAKTASGLMTGFNMITNDDDVDVYHYNC